MKANNIYEFEFIGGKLKYYIDENGDAVIIDYVGENEILCFPMDLGWLSEKYDTSIPVANYIPDESFQSCTKVKTVIFGTDMKLGLFLFTNCDNLSTVVSIDSSIDYDEFSFTKKNYAPPNIKTFELITTSYGDDAYDEHCFDRFECNHLILSITVECSKSNDYERINNLVSLKNIGCAINTAIEKDSVERLLFIESLGIKMNAETPFILEISDAIKHGAYNVFDLLLSRKVFSVGWSKGSLLYAAVISGKLDLVLKSLKAGASPFSKSPEWDGERLVSDVAKELGEVEMLNAIVEAQKETSSLA